MTIELIDIVIALIVALIATLWWQNAAIREQALQHVKQHCIKHDLQLLDESVALKKWRIIWQKGQASIQRQYYFEFTSTGEARYVGIIRFNGQKLDHISLAVHHI